MSELVLIERTYSVDDVDVDEAGRIVVVRVVPYNRPTVASDTVEDPRRGLSTRPYREGWRPGAFRAAAKAPHRVPFVVGVAGGHAARKSNPWADVGRAKTLEEHDDALYAELALDRSPFGDAALAKIETGQWRGISVGARGLAHVDEGDPYSAGVRWRTRAGLDHILLTEVPAYREAEVLAVREAVESPRLAHWRAKYPAREPA